jgi:hypothetical protein
LNSRLRPSDSVSVTCIDHTSFAYPRVAPDVSVERQFARSALCVVRAEGLEPPRLSSPEPKSGASTNSATPAKGNFKTILAPQSGRA